MARTHRSRRDRRRQHATKDQPRNLGDLDISSKVVGADEGRPEKAPKDVEKSDGLVVAKKEGNASGAKELTERRADRGNENDAWKSRNSLPKTRSGSTACQGAAEDAVHITGASDG
jgi:hypothetical protein